MNRLPDDNSGRRIQRYIYSRPPSSTPTRARTISPRSRPTESVVASGLSRLRFAPAVFRFIPFPVGGKSAGRHGKGSGREDLGDWQAVAL